MKPTCTIILDKRKPKKTGKYPAKLRVTYLRKQYYYPLFMDFSEEEYLHMNNSSLIPKNAQSSYKKTLELAKLAFSKELVKANAIIDHMLIFDKQGFEMRFYGAIKPAQSLKEYYKQEIDLKNNAGCVGTARSYQSSLTSLLVFKPNLSFTDLTPDFLRQYEAWFTSSGKSITTVGIYLRPLRAIVQKAIEDGNYPRDSYPFGRRKYQIPTGRNIKKALTTKELALIFNYDAQSNIWHQKARDFFIFSYLASGMNMKDILNLKGNNMDGEYIRFNRSKTKATTKGGSMPISIPICSNLKEIIRKWGNHNPGSSEFLFGILQPGMTPASERAQVQQFTKMVNKYMKQIAERLGIHKPITTYFARHSFATIMKKSGASIEFIRESLGHTNIATTTSYLDSFDDETKREMHLMLTQFLDAGKN